MRVEVIPSFITQEEINELNNWVELGVKNKWLDVGVSSGKVTKLRVTSRFYPDRYEYPKIVRDLSTKIRKTLGVEERPLIDGHGRDGVVVSYTYPKGDVYKHKDPKSIDGLATLRCNILTQAADAGGILYIEGQQVDVKEGDLHCYLVSEHEHWATEVEGSTPRIMWMFGAHVEANDWNSGKIKVKNDSTK